MVLQSGWPVADYRSQVWTAFSASAETKPERRNKEHHNRCASETRTGHDQRSVLGDMPVANTVALDEFEKLTAGPVRVLNQQHRFVLGFIHLSLLWMRSLLSFCPAGCSALLGVVVRTMQALGAAGPLVGMIRHPST